MQPNPFEYGNPITDPAKFFGRQSELNQIRDRLYQMASTSVVGERRIGKTSLLRIFTVPEVATKLGLGEDYVFCYVDWQGFDQIQPVQFWELVLTELANKFKDPTGLAEIKGLLENQGIDEFSLRRLFAKLKPTRMVLLFDEFDTVVRNPNLTASFYGTLRHLAQHYSLALVTASIRELYYYCINEQIGSSPFFNIFANLVVEPFHEHECQELVTAYLKETGVDFSETELKYLFEMSGGFPSLLQIACHSLFYAYLDKSLQKDPDARQFQVAEYFRREGNPHFAYYWKNSEEGEKILLALFALLHLKGEKQLSEAGIKELYPRYQQSLLALRSRSMILQTNGNYRIFSPVFAQWIFGELTDISQKGEATLDEWLKEYEKGLATKGYERVRELILKVNPKYWKMLGKILLDAKNQQIIKDLLEKLKQVF
ncbi:AAA-like domain-containing protein [candidate division KSB1 bacterium]|nr:AAA-like domain-containing protein [candidate division KSB1 bacterium]